MSLLPAVRGPAHAALPPELESVLLAPRTRELSSASLAVVIPAYREAANVAPLLDEVRATLKDLVGKLHVVFAEDGSPDNTADALRQLAESQPDVSVVFLARNFGHQIALTAGIDLALTLRPDIIVCLDGDFQHPPSVIPRLLDAWQQGSDLVVTSRRTTADVGPIKRLGSWAIYKVLNALGEHRLVPGAADFRLMSGHAAAVLASMREEHRFIRGMVAWQGFRPAIIEYDAPPRRAGQSSYSLTRMLKFAWDGLLDSGPVPLRLASWLGLIIALLTSSYAAYVLSVWLLTDRAVPGWTSTILAVLFLGSIQLLGMGLLGEYVGRIYTQTKARPLYTVASVAGGVTKTPAD